MPRESREDAAAEETLTDFFFRGEEDDASEKEGEDDQFLRSPEIHHHHHHHHHHRRPPAAHRPQSAAARHMVAPVPAVFYFDEPHHQARHNSSAKFPQEQAAVSSPTRHPNPGRCDGDDGNVDSGGTPRRMPLRPKSAGSGFRRGPAGHVHKSAARPKSAAAPKKSCTPAQKRNMDTPTPTSRSGGGSSSGGGGGSGKTRRPKSAAFPANKMGDTRRRHRPKSAAPSSRRHRSDMMHNYREKKKSMQKQANSRLHRELTGLDLRRPVLQFHRRAAIMERRAEQSSVSEIALKTQRRQLQTTLNTHTVFTQVVSAMTEAVRHPLRAAMNDRMLARFRMLGHGHEHTQGEESPLMTTAGEKRFLGLLRQLLLHDGGASIPWVRATFALLDRMRFQSPEDFRDPHVAVGLFALLESTGTSLNTFKSWCRKRHVALPRVLTLAEAKEAAGRAAMKDAAMSSLAAWTDKGND